MRALIPSVTLLLVGAEGVLLGSGAIRSFDATGTGDDGVGGGRVHSLRRPNLLKNVGQQTLHLELQNHVGMQYSAPITLGDQTLLGVYDTGSFDIMTISSHCLDCNSSLRLYSSETSETFQRGDRPAGMHVYEGGHMLARQDFETVRIGDLTSSLKAERMAFWQVLETNMSVWTENRASFTVIVGLGHRNHVPGMGPGNVSESLLERVGSHRFAICLESGRSNPGWLTINPEVSVATNGVFRTVPVVGKHHWAANLASVQLAEGMSNPCEGGCVAIVDSGTSMLAAPPQALGLMWGVIQNVSHDCSNLEELPDLVFELGGHKFIMPPVAYVIQAAYDPIENKPTMCFPAFMDIDMSTDLGAVWVLGMPFLRRFHTVFDREAPSLHIAEHGDGCKLPTAVGSAAQSSNFVAAEGLTPRRQGEPTFGDPRFARAPAWARRGGHIDV